LVDLDKEIIMQFIERTQGLIEPDIKELDSDVTELVSMGTGYAIIGDEQPETIKNMAQGLISIYKKGIVFYCEQLPQKYPKGFKDNISLFLGYQVWEAAGFFGLLAKEAVSGVAESIIESKKNPNEKSPEEILSFRIPIINIIGADNFLIKKRKISLSSIKVIKILTENSKDEEFIFWINADKVIINNLFKLRYEQEKAIGVSDLTKFRDYIS
jgi:hypothetical protein